MMHVFNQAITASTLISRVVAAGWEFTASGQFPTVPEYGPQPNVAYMVDNQHNYFKAAPDKGTQNGAVWLESGSFENYMSKLRANGTLNGPSGHPVNSSLTHKRQDDPSSYWLTKLAPLGKQPLAGDDYKFYRNVVSDYGADPTGERDSTEAINAAVEDGNRCGLECGNTFTLGAIVYFPPGTYKICRPIVQMYYTQFIGDVIEPPTIKGCETFEGIALIDTDPYIPGGNGKNWYVNQNQFFRQIRNFVFDLTEMPLRTSDGDQPLVPTGIHWQVAQATTLQNLVFDMPVATADNQVTHVGIFTENGSGGFVSDLTFNGGNIGWRVGSQQYTARNLQFNRCLTAVQMVWDWGFNWQGINVNGGAVAFNISGRGGDTGQGIGSVSIIDCTVQNVPVAVLTNMNLAGPPGVVIDNLVLNNVQVAVQSTDDGAVLLSGGGDIDLWAVGRRYNGSKGSFETGPVIAPRKAQGLLSDDGKSLYVRSRPQYEVLSEGDFLVATNENIKNDGTGDQTAAINAFLRKAVKDKKVAYFPAGIYQVGGTVFIPTNSRVQGSSWSQIMGSGFYFNDINQPRVMVKVGNPGEIGTMEIVEMLFTVKGMTAGAVLMEWNVHESTQGAAAMWDSHFRVGGGLGTDLDFEKCPKHGFNNKCIAAQLMLHVTPQSSGYFENVWAWTADHDNDMSVVGNPDPVGNQISVYAARGMLIESAGPSWFYGTGSEHCVLYQYQLNKANNTYLGHIQTETPYYQPNPVAPEPFTSGKGFPADPSFADCKGNGTCKDAWALRILDSSSVTIHSAGMYSFFQDYEQDCVKTFSCQERLMQVKGSKDVVLFNVFTVGSVEVATGVNGELVFQNETQNGFTTEVSVYLPTPGDDHIEVVYIGEEVYTEPSAICPPPCIMVLPPSPLPTPLVIDAGNYTTSFEYGGVGEVTNAQGEVTTTFFTNTTTIIIAVPPVTVNNMSFSNVNVTAGATTGEFIPEPSITFPRYPVTLPDGSGSSTIRNVTLPPWPEIGRGPRDGPGWGNPTDPWITAPNPASSTDSETFTAHTPFVTTVSASTPTVTTLTFPEVVSPTTFECPPVTDLTFNTPKTTLRLGCPTETEQTVAFSCPQTQVVTFLAASAGVFTVDCTWVTIKPPGTILPGPPPTDSTTTTTSSTTRPLPVWATWPPLVIEPSEEEVDDPEPETDGVVVPCKLWFFSICLIRDNIEFPSWHWIIPPGIYPPGPPPPIRWPPGWTFHGSLPPWPEITIGPNHEMTYSRDPEQCTTKIASLCSTTTVFSEVTSTDGEVETTATSTSSICQTIYGCDVTNTNTQITSTTRTGCPTGPAPARATAGASGVLGLVPGNTSTVAIRHKTNETETIERRQEGPSPEDCGDNAIIYPRNPANVGNIPNLLQAYAGQYVEVKATGYTSYFWVPLLDINTMEQIQQSPDVEFAYYYEEWNKNVPDDTPNNEDSLMRASRPAGPLENVPRALELVEVSTSDDASNTANNATLVERDGDHGLDKRMNTYHRSKYYEMGQVSLPRGMAFRSPESESYVTTGAVNFNSPYRFYHDDMQSPIAGDWEEQFVYIIGEAYVWRRHDEFAMSTGRIEELPVNTYGLQPPPEVFAVWHGSGVAAKIMGATLGICKRCTVVWFNGLNIQPDDPNYVQMPGERNLEHLTNALNDIRAKARQGRAVINMSWSVRPDQRVDSYFRRLNGLLRQLEAEGAVLVCTSSNHATPDGDAGEPAEGKPINRYPALFQQPNPYGDAIPNLIIVGATDDRGREADFSQYASWMTTFAPGQGTYIPRITSETGRTDRFQQEDGTSYAAPQVAALAAYFRAMPTKWRDQLKEDPGRVKKLIRLFHRRISLYEVSGQIIPPDPVLSRPIIWNGQVKFRNCLSEYETRSAWDDTGACPDLEDDLDDQSEDLVEPIESHGGSCAIPAGASRVASFAAAPFSFPSNSTSLLNTTLSLSPSRILPRAAPGSGGSCGGITFRPGPTPQPTCTAGCGTLCTGYYCSQPTPGLTPPLPPPDFRDPKDPNAGNPVPPTSVIDGPTTTSTPTGGPTPPPVCDDKCKLDNGNACSCDGAGCSPDSPGCCSSGTCPACDCSSEQGCTPESPACCASGNCLWACAGDEIKVGCPFFVDPPSEPQGFRGFGSGNGTGVFSNGTNTGNGTGEGVITESSWVFDIWSFTPVDRGSGSGIVVPPPVFVGNGTTGGSSSNETLNSFPSLSLSRSKLRLKRNDTVPGTDTDTATPSQSRSTPDFGFNPNHPSILGFDGKIAGFSPCGVIPVWSTASSSSSSPGHSTIMTRAGPYPTLQLNYKNIRVFGDRSCEYVASVASYDGVAPGDEVGVMTCGKYRDAVCFRGEYQRAAGRTVGTLSLDDEGEGVDQTCLGGVLKEEIVCRWV